MARHSIDLDAGHEQELAALVAERGTPSLTADALLAELATSQLDQSARARKAQADEALLRSINRASPLARAQALAALGSSTT
jgi:hypothetical protein